MKKSLRFLLVVLMVLTMSVIMPLTAQGASGDELRASKKVISVVYDDSGSMIGPRWSYTNYAMQSLIALLNEQDELYITLMTEPETAVPVNTSDLQGAVRKIHDLSEAGGTPGEALDTARNKLDTITESDPSVQYWMVILTDGEISMSSTIQNKLNSYKNNTMSNGSLLNVVYMSMGDAAKASDDKANKLYTYSAVNDTEIAANLHDVANLISGRLNADEVKQVNDTTITVSSKLPLYSISILSQKSAAKVASAKTKETPLNVERNISVDATDLEKGTNIQSLFGNAAVINKKNTSGDADIIPADTYTITFSEKIDVNNMNVQVEPAIALKAEISRNGVIIDDTTKLGNGEKVDIRIIPVIPGTDTVIADDALPKQIEWNIHYEVNGNIVDSAKGTDLTGVVLTEGENLIRGTIHIPGYSPFSDEISFRINKIEYHFGIDVKQPEGLAYNRSEFDNLSLDDSNTIRFILTNDGKPLSKEDQQSIGVELTIDSIDCTELQDSNIVYTMGKTKVNCDLVQNDDGSYSLIPSSPFMTPKLSLQAGSYKVTVSVTEDSSVKAEGTFEVVPSMEEAKDIPYYIIGFLLFLYLLYLLFIKKKFKGQVVHYATWRIQSDGTGVEQKSSTGSRSLGFFSGHFLLPQKACYVKYMDLKLVADDNGTVIITPESIAHAYEKYGRNSADCKKHLGRIAEQLHKTKKKDGKREASEEELTEKNLYLMRSENGKDVICVWMTDH